MSDLIQYIAAILLEKARADPDEAYGGSARSIRNQLVAQISSNVKAEDVEKALNVLLPFAAAESDFSPLTDGFWTINYDNFRYYYIEENSAETDDAQSYAETREKTSEYPVLQAYARRGERYANDAAQHLRIMTSAEWERLRGQGNQSYGQVPASDRIVSLTDNQQTEIEDAASELINLVEEINSIDQSPSLRQRFIGQLKAARELVRAQSVNGYLLYLTTAGILAHLYDKYAGQAIGEAAKKLLDLLIEHVFKS